MRPDGLRQASSEALFQRFVAIGLAQYEAAYVGATTTYNRLYGQMIDVRDELQRRPGDQRRILHPLLAHPNMQVRMMAANTLLAIFPIEARKALETVRDSDVDPQNANAASAIRALDDGLFVPT